MATTKDIGGLHGTLTLSMQQYIAEFERADAATQMHARGMKTASESLVHDVERSFTGAKFAKGLLEGFGIGTGITVVTKLADHFVEMWQEGAKYAEEMEKSAEKVWEVMHKLSQAKFDASVDKKESPYEKLSLLRAEEGRLQLSMNNLQRRREEAAAGFSKMTSLGLYQNIAGYDFNNTKSFFGIAATQHGGENDGPRYFTPAAKAGEILRGIADDAQVKWAAANEELLKRQKEEKALTDQIKKEKDAQSLLNGANGPNLRGLKEISPEQEAAAYAMGREAAEELRKAGEHAPDKALTNAFGRVGLLGGVADAHASEAPKQTALLIQIRDAARRQLEYMHPEYSGSGYTN